MPSPKKKEQPSILGSTRTKRTTKSNAQPSAVETKVIKFNFDPPAVSRPYIFAIKNSSFDRIEDFQLNNIAQAIRIGKYDDRVKLDYGLSEFTCEEALRKISKGVRIGRLRIESHHDYGKYQQIQVNTPLTYKKSNVDGTVTLKPIVVHMALNQFITNITETPVDLLLEDSWGLSFSLMPEVFVKVYLYPVFEK
jgi:hypothetical protein